jgi:hypothetical protein
LTARSRRVAIRALLIALQWVCVTVAVGSFVMRSEASLERLISPHLGAAPMFVAAFFGALLLGLTIESPRYMVPLVILMCLTAAAFIGVLTYAPVIDGAIIRTTTLDNWVLQRTIVVGILLLLAATPGAAAGNLLGGYLNVRHELFPHPEDLRENEEVPWWERRQETPTSSEQRQVP